VLVTAVLAGFFMLSLDQRTDDAGVEAALLLAISLALAVAAPRRALAVGLAVGLPIAAWGVIKRERPRGGRARLRTHRSGSGVADAPGIGRRALRLDLLHFEALALVRDLGVRVDRLQPGRAARVQGLERLRLGNAGPQELGVLVRCAF
jgi:hypothetical protein